MVEYSTLLKFKIKVSLFLETLFWISLCPEKN